MAARFVSTSRLSNIIQMIALSRQSGIIRVVRGQPPSREMGQIRFVDGEPIAAMLGSLTGQGALNVLMNWGECSYAFDEGALDGLDEAAGGMPNYGSAGNPSSVAPYPSGSWPSYGYSQSNVASPLPSEAPFGSQPGYVTGYGGVGGGGSTDQFGRAMPSVGTAAQIRPDMLMAIPVRAPIGENVDQLPLDRRERMVLLLVDGQRSIADLTRLTRRADQEVFAVLNHLAMLGLVQFRR